MLLQLPPMHVPLPKSHEYYYQYIAGIFTREKMVIDTVLECQGKYIDKLEISGINRHAMSWDRLCH